MMKLPTAASTTETTSGETGETEPSSEETSPTESESKPSRSPIKNPSTATTTTTTTIKKPVKYMYQFSDAARVYLSNSKSTFVRQNDAFKIYSKKNLDASTGLIVEFDANVTEHEIEGFGGAMTDTSAQMLSALPEKTREMLMEKLFDAEKGIGLSMIRGCVGSSDFATEYYTYDDMPEGEEDWDLKHFDMSYDHKQIIPLMKDAMAINKNIKFLLSPWTPPLWMKTRS